MHFVNIFSAGFGWNPYLQMDRSLVDLANPCIDAGYLIWCQNLSLSPDLQALYPASYLGEDTLEPLETCKNIYIN